jgi:hypothetical protein
MERNRLMLHPIFHSLVTKPLRSWKLSNTLFWRPNSNHLYRTLPLTRPLSFNNNAVVHGVLCCTWWTIVRKSRVSSLTIDAGLRNAYLEECTNLSGHPLSVYHWNASHSPNFTSHWLLVQCSGQANPPIHVTPEQKGKPTYCKCPIPYKQPTTRNAFYNQDGWVSLPTIALHAYITLPLVSYPVLFLHNRALQFTCSVTITLFRPNHLATTLPIIQPQPPFAHILHKL